MDDQSRLQLVELPTGGSGRAVIRCEYRVHTNHRFEQEQQNRRYWQGVGIGFLTFATLLAGGLGIGAMLREQQRFERERELERKQAQSALAAEHRERELAEAQRAAEELERKVLQGELEKAKIEGRAAEAERSALEMKSQLYASIGIMAGSYAHNIKNLLVRPNDLLSRCIEVNGLSGEQEGMLREVKTTLGTVTERLQQILRTVRRDPNRAEMTRVDLAGLVRESLHTWAGMAWDKWKVRLVAEVPVEPLTVNGDLSHLQQAVENLVFNARDATFEMRNHLREDARRNPALDPAARKQRLIEAAAWKGEVHLRARREDGFAVLEVQDNGIGMTDEVRENCLKTHFTTKRDNALYEGYSAGMGLGLSFVAVVLEHHGADLEIESAPLHGALFRVRIPLAEGERS
jgi:signal transduction histidine kinase